MSPTSSQQQINAANPQLQQSKSSMPAAPADLKSEQQRSNKPAADKSAASNSRPQPPTVAALAQTARKSGADDPSKIDPKTNSGPYTKVDKNTAIKVWYDRSGNPAKYELFKLDDKGNPQSSAFYSTKQGKLEVAKKFGAEAENKPAGVQVNLTVKELRDAHQQVKAVGDDKLTALQRMAASKEKNPEGYVDVNKTTRFREWNINGAKQFEVIDLQTNKSYFYDKNGKLLLEKNLAKQVNGNHEVKKPSEVATDTLKRLEDKLTATIKIKPEGASDSLFHADGREISAETKKAVQALNGSMKSVLRGGNDDATFFKTLDGISEEKRHDIVEAYKKMYGVDLIDKVKKEFWGSLRRDRAEALVNGDKIAAKSAELQQKIEDSKTLWIFPDATKSRDAVGEATRDLSAEEAKKLQEEHKKKYTDVRDQLGTTFSDKDKKAVELYYAGDKLGGDVYSLASENDKVTFDKRRSYRDSESVEKNLERNVKNSKELQERYKLETGHDIKADTKAGEVNRFTNDRYDALIDGNKNKAIAIRLAEEKQSGLSVDKVIETLDGTGLEAASKIAAEYDRYVTKKIDGQGDAFRAEMMKLATSDEEKTELAHVLQYGELDDAMKLVRATRGLGTDDDKVKEIIERNKADKLEGLDKKLKVFYGNGAGVDGIIASELGKDSDLEFDYQEARKYGTPKTPEEQMASIDRRYQRENANRSAVVDGWWSPEDAKNLDETHKLAQLRYLEYQIAKEYGSKLETERISKDISRSYDSYLESENTYRVARKEASDSVATGAATVVAVTAGTVATVATGGVLAPIIIGGVASFVTRVAVRNVLEGDSYSSEDIAADAGSALIDGIAGGAGGKAAAFATRKLALKLAANELKRSGIQLAEAALKEAAEKIVEKQIGSLSTRLAAQATDLIVNNGVEGGISGAGTVLGDRRFWQGDISEKLALTTNAALLGATTGIVTSALIDTGISVAGRLRRGNGVDVEIGDPDITVIRQNGSDPSGSSPVNIEPESLRVNSGIIQTPPDRRTNINNQAITAFDTEATVAAPTAGSNGAAAVQSSSTANTGNVTDAVTSNLTGEETDIDLLNTSSNTASLQEPVTAPLDVVEENAVGSANTLTETTSGNQNGSSTESGSAVTNNLRESSANENTTFAQTNPITTNQPAEAAVPAANASSPLVTNPLAFDQFNHMASANAQKLPEHVEQVPGMPNGMFQTTNLGFFFVSEFNDDLLPYSAVAQRKPGNNIDEIRLRYQQEKIPQRIEDFPQVSELNVTNISVTNSEHGGSAGIIKLATIPHPESKTGRPVIIKTYKDADLADEELLKELQKAQMLNDLGIITFHGVHIDAKGRPNLVMDFVPGAFVSSQNGHLVNSGTFDELDNIISRLEFAKIPYLGDFQFHLTKNGHVGVIDPGGLGLPWDKPSSYTNLNKEANKQRAILLIYADYQTGTDYLNRVYRRDPQTFTQLMSELNNFSHMEGALRYRNYSVPQTTPSYGMPDTANPNRTGNLVIQPGIEINREIPVQVSDQFIKVANTNRELRGPDPRYKNADERIKLYDSAGRKSRSQTDPVVIYLKDADFKNIAPNNKVASFYDRDHQVVILRDRKPVSEYDKIKIAEEFVHEREHYYDRNSNFSSREKEVRAYRASEKYLNNKGYEYYVEDRGGFLEIEVRKRSADNLQVANRSIVDDSKFKIYLDRNYPDHTVTLRMKVESRGSLEKARESIFEKIIETENYTPEIQGRIFENFELLISSRDGFVTRLNSLASSGDQANIMLLNLLDQSPEFKQLLRDEFVKELPADLKIRFGVFENKINLNFIPDRKSSINNGINNRLEELGVRNAQQRLNLETNKPIADSYVQHAASLLNVDPSSVRLTRLMVENRGSNTIYQQFVGDIEINGQVYTVRWHSALDGAEKKASSRVVSLFSDGYNYELINRNGLSQQEINQFKNANLLYDDGKNLWVKVRYQVDAGNNGVLKTEIASNNANAINILNERRHIKGRHPKFLLN